MNWEQAAYLIGAGLLVLLNAFFVLAEFAIVKVRVTRMHQLAEKGNTNAALAASIIKRLDAYLSTCQLGITVASLGLGWLGEPAIKHLLQPLIEGLGPWSKAVSSSIAIAISFCFITLIHVVIGELAPKSVAIRRTEWAALAAARPLHAFYLITFPAMWILNVTSNAVLWLLRIPPVSDMEMAHSEEELKMILGASHEQGELTLNRLLMMENVLDFGTLRVRDVMTPGAKVITLSARAPWPENFEKIKATLHSRYPLETGTRGPSRIVHIKDVAVSLASGAPPDLLKISRVVKSVRPDMPLEDLLQHFNRNHSHLAIVEDDRGAYFGIVSIEDVVEELIGTVRDEFEQVKEVRLAELVPPEAVALNLEPSPKAQVIRALVERIARKRPEISVDAVVSGILKRESLASTGLGNGIAIPHGRVEGIARPVAAIGRSEKGIDFQSLDGNPAHLLFLILTPVHDEGVHVHILGKISRLLASDYLRERLIHASTPEEAMEVLKVADQSLSA
ncbi:MAG TPA: CNNM domain-containing protein [Planctomycetota bacterium]|nr:CNNM domain-containing protein [Planctomycetota bacterium]